MKALYKSYPSNLTSDQWAIMEPYLPAAKPGGRPPRVNLRAVLDAIFYFLYSGCAWRRFQGTFPLGLSVYTYFQGWREQGVWERINPYLRQWCAWDEPFYQPQCCHYLHRNDSTDG